MIKSHCGFRIDVMSSKATKKGAQNLLKLINYFLMLHLNGIGILLNVSCNIVDLIFLQKNSIFLALLS